MSSLKQKYEEFTEFMQHDTNGVKMTIFGVSGALLAIAYYRQRPITKFGQPKDIPKRFITHKVIQNGTIKAIEPNLSAGAVLRIDHKPPLNLFFFSHKTLPVKLFGVDLSGNGYSWLQSITLNRNVQFLPINKNNTNFAECQPSIDLAEALISIGFAKTSQQIDAKSTDEQLKIYQKQLQAKQRKVLRRESSWSLTILLINLIYKLILPAKYRLPELVR